MSARVERLADWVQLVRAAGRAWLEDYAPSMGAALSYYMVFSMAPLLLIVISVAGLVFGVDAAHGRIFGELQGLLGETAARSIEGLLASVSQPVEGSIAAVVGVAFMLLGATTVFGELQDALDRIWRAPARQGAGGLWGLVRTRLLSFGLILGIAFLLMVSLVLGALVSALGAWWGGLFGGWERVAQAVNLAVGFGLTTAVFAMIYKLMPRVRVRWADVALGAFVTATLFTLGKLLIGLYIGRSGVTSAFGAAGSLVVVLLWVYYSAQIFLMGAEFTWVYARTFGSMRGLEAPGLAQPSQPEAVPRRSSGPSAADKAVVVGAALEPSYVASAATGAPDRRSPWPAVAAGLGAGLVGLAMGRLLSNGPRRR